LRIAVTASSKAANGCPCTRILGILRHRVASSQLAQIRSHKKLARQWSSRCRQQAVADDPDRLFRFTREAQLLAPLNHPHIAYLHGIEEAASTGLGQPVLRALVMELVEGPTLADRISRGAIPIDKALCLAAQIADALEAARALPARA